MAELSEAAKEARAEYLRNWRANRTEEQKERARAYHRKWQKRYPEKQKEYHRRYWERKAAQAAQADTNNAE